MHITRRIMQSPRVLFRCNAGHEIGFGHVSRCLSIALALREGGADVCFALGSAEAVPRIEGRGFSVHVLAAEVPDDSFFQVLDAIKPNVLFLDVRPPHSHETLHKVRKLVPIIAALDDISYQRFFADHVFLPPTPTVKNLDWDGFTGQVHVGLEWMPLGDTFIVCPHNPWTGKGVFRLLMAMGGSDPWGYTKQLAHQVAQICADMGIELAIVIGPGFQDRIQQILTCQQLTGRPLVFDNPAQMSDAYGWCHAALSVFCVSAYELAACGRPALYICPNEDYEEHASVFVKKGLGKVLLAPLIDVGFFPGLLRENLNSLLSQYNSTPRPQLIYNNISGITSILFNVERSI